MAIKIQDSDVKQHWQDFGDLLQVFERMHSVERWTKDNQLKFRQRVVSWSEGVNPKDIPALSDIKLRALIVLMFFMQAARATTLWVQIVEVNQDMHHRMERIARDMLEDEKYSRPARIFFERLNILSFQSVASTCLDTSRIKHLTDIITQIKENNGGFVVE